MHGDVDLRVLPAIVVFRPEGALWRCPLELVRVVDPPSRRLRLLLPLVPAPRPQALGPDAEGVSLFRSLSQG